MQPASSTLPETACPASVRQMVRYWEQADVSGSLPKFYRTERVWDVGGVGEDQAARLCHRLLVRPAFNVPCDFDVAVFSDEICPVVRH